MPDKEGSDDEKTTKGVVKKKRKQMMGEEGYDTYRDNILMRGGDHRSKETKERSYTPSKQPKGQTAAQKAAKGKSALELVKANITKKYGKGAIMDVKKKSKKKANEELDLTKIAEAFGGYIIVEKIDPITGKYTAGGDKSQQKFEKGFSRSKEGIALRKKFKRTEASKKAAEKASKEAETASSAIDPSQKQFVQGGRYSQSKIPKEVRDPITGEPLTRDYDLPPKEQERQDQETKQTPEYQQAKADAKQGVANPKEFSTYTGTQAQFDADKAERERRRSIGKGDGRKAGRTKEEKRTGKVTYKTFVNKPEVTGGRDRTTDTDYQPFRPETKPETDKVTQSQTAFVEPPLQPEKKPRTIPFKEPKEYSPETQRQINQIKRNIEKREKENPDRRTKKYKEAQTQTQADGGGKGGGNKIVKTGRGGGKPFKNFATSLVKLTRDNPVASLIGYDQLKSMQNPFALRGGRAGIAAARGGGGL